MVFRNRLPLLRIFQISTLVTSLTISEAGRAQTATAAGPLGLTPAAVAVNPWTNKIYVANCIASESNTGGNGTVAVIDAATNTSKTVSVGVCPTAVAVNPVTNKIYVANFGQAPSACESCRPNGSVTVIDGLTNTTTTLQDSNAKFPYAVAVNPITNKIYVASFDHAAGSLGTVLSVIDGATNVWTGLATHASPEPLGLAVNFAEDRLYVTNPADGAKNNPHNDSVSTIDGVSTSSPEILDPKELAISADPPSPTRARISNAKSNVASSSIPNWGGKNPKWHPLDIDETSPDVDATRACQLAEVISNASIRVNEFIQNVNRISATEVLEHDHVDRHGKFVDREQRKFNYVAMIEETQPRALNIDEYRDGRPGIIAFPTEMATFGMNALTLIFHPYHLNEFEVTCEGLGVWRERPAWQVHFRQRKDQPATISAFRAGQMIYPALLKGRAWFDAESYQIVHLETDLLEPIPEIRLYVEHQALDYAPVKFEERKLVLWLPQQAEIYLDSRGKHLHHRHIYSDYRLFSVDSAEKLGSPK
jgi:DNA-binding beta-propeller fold protein YncE